MTGGTGNDTYVVDDAGDVVIESARRRHATRCSRRRHYTLGANVENLTLTGAGDQRHRQRAANVITGNGAVNTLNGLGGNDTLDGGAGSRHAWSAALGNDTYVVDNAGDVVIESGGEGIDTVQSPRSATRSAPMSRT